MSNRKEKLSLITKLLAVVACLVLSFFVLFNANFINKQAESELSPVIMKNVAAVDQNRTDSINMEFKRMMLKYPDISSVVLYKFVRDKGTSMYAGQINVTSETRDGSIIPKDNSVVPMIDGTNNVQEILLNNVHYENTSTIELLCEGRFDTTQAYSCEKYKRIGNQYKSVVSVPIVQNIDVGVIGYVMITLGSEYDNLQVQSLVNNIRPYLANIQLLAK